MRSVTVALAVATALTACRAVPPTPAPPPPAVHAARVVLLSLDGVAAERNEALLAAGAYHDPDGFAAFPGHGWYVEHAIAVDPTLTAVSHASIATGAFPERTGIVSNVFHVPGTPILDTVSGFDTPLGAEPVWQAFRRQGKRVGVLLFPGVAEGSADFGMTYVSTAASTAAEVETIPRADFTVTAATPTGDAPPATATFSVPLRAKGLPRSATFTLTAEDTVADGKAAYDTLVVDDDADPGNGVLARVHPGEWFPLTLTAAHPDGGRELVGAWCLLQALPADLATVRFYRGAFYATAAYPRAFRERLDHDAGFWPGPPDDRALERGLEGNGGISLDAYEAQVARFSEFLNACAGVAFASERFDLLVAYQPEVDEVEHALLIADPRQRDYSEGLAATAQRVLADTYRVADRAVGALARHLDLSRDALVVVSDHGMAPLWELVNVNEVLHRQGLAEVQEGGRYPRVAASSEMVAVGSGGCAHLYLNLAGREPGGVVQPADAEVVVLRAARALALLEVDGEGVVDRMFRRSELGEIGLASPNAGDLVVFLKPGFAATSRIGGAETEPSPYYGQHGYLNTHPELAAIWMARGAGVPVRRVERASLTEVAAFVARLAGVSPPRDASPVPGMTLEH